MGRNAYIVQPPQSTDGWFESLSPRSFDNRSATRFPKSPTRSHCAGSRTSAP